MLHQWLGDDDFGRMMLSYLAYDRPKAASIRWFGDRMSDFLEQISKDPPFAFHAEVARFEWALRHTVDAADAERYTFDALQTQTSNEWLGLELNLDPSVTLLEMKWNAIPWVQAALKGAPLPTPQRQPSRWVIYRDRDGSAAWRSLDGLEWMSLNPLQSRITFQDLLASLVVASVRPEEAAASAAEYLRLWVEEGLLVSVPNPAH